MTESANDKPVEKLTFEEAAAELERLAKEIAHRDRLYCRKDVVNQGVLECGYEHN